MKRQSGYRIPVCAPLLTGREQHYLKKCLDSSWISSAGPLVSQFEQRFADFCDAKFGVTTNSGTTALHLALAALRVSRGDEVILPSFAMIACINAVEYTGAKAVLIDSDEQTWCMDVSQIEPNITRRTKAIMAVHTYGHPVDMDPVLELAQRHHVHVIEDAAEAHGALYKGRKVGSLGKVGSFSFYSNKIITTGEGGMNVTNDAALADRMAWLRAHAFGKEGRHFWHEELGFGYRMSALQAAVGLGQLDHIKSMVRARRTHAALYNELLRNVEELILPPQMSWAKNVYWMYSVRVKDQSKRDALMARLANRGIETRTFFYPIHLQPYYAGRYRGQDFPVANALSRSGINLPSGNGLTSNEIEEICDVIKSFFVHKR
jgi:perosamine synthetase